MPVSDDASAGATADVTVIGAGVAGLWAALALHDAGLVPRILDRNGPPGPHGCSWWAGGMLAPHCEGVTAEPQVVRLGLEAAAAWGSVTRVVHEGSLVVALDRDLGDLRTFAARSVGHRTLDREGLRGLEPDLAPRAQALFFPDEAHLDPRRALADLVEALARRGVFIERRTADPADVPGRVVDARGRAAGLPGLRGVRGEMIVLRAPEIELRRPVRLLHPRHPLYIVPRGEGLFMLGATQIESEDRRRISARSLLELLSAAWALDPRFAEAEVVETGVDLRPAFRDHLPRGIVRGRVVHLNGLFRHGFLLAPALGRQAATFLAHGERGELIQEG